MINVSIIVPVYNVEKYLERCVKSLIEQEEDIEIILINDGSKDRSYEIMQELAKEDARISIYTQENKGVAYTRNRGISLAKGKYIYFVDSDDFIDKRTISTMLEYAQKYDTDYVKIAYIKDISEAKGKTVSGVIYKEPTFVKRDNFKDKVFKIFLNTYDLNQIWSFIIKKEFLLENNIFFEDGSFYAEDLVFCLKVFMHLENAVFLPFPYYHYVNNPNSITTQINYNGLQKKIGQAVKNYSYLRSFFEEFDLNKEKRINKRITKEVIVCIKLIYQKNQSFDKSQRVEMIDYAKKILNENNIKHNLFNNSKLIDFWYLIKYRYILGTLKLIVKKILYR